MILLTAYTEIRREIDFFRAISKNLKLKCALLNIETPSTTYFDCTIPQKKPDKQIACQVLTINKIFAYCSSGINMPSKYFSFK